MRRVSDLPAAGPGALARPGPGARRGRAPTAALLRRAAAIVAPGVLVAVGYVDPGNWSTDLAAGSRFGLALLSVVVLASAVALLVQVLAARLGAASGLDLAEATRALHPRAAAAFWALAELAIVATDLAEVLGAAIALRLLFGLPLVAGVLLTGLDVLAILAFPRGGPRSVTWLVLGLLLVVTASLAFELALAHPAPAEVARGLLPDPGALARPGALWVAMGIVGATVMPHNLYLHSALVRADAPDPEARRRAVRRAAIGTVAALSGALVVNAAILVLAAAALPGAHAVDDLSNAYRLLAPALGSAAAAPVFAIALLAAGQSAALTGTLAGQVVATGFLRVRWRPWVRRLVTRALALVPAVAVTAVAGERAAAVLLVGSQVALTLQLPFALVPLLRATADRRLMGELVAPRWLRALGWASAAAIVAMGVALLAAAALGRAGAWG